MQILELYFLRFYLWKYCQTISLLAFILSWGFIGAGDNLVNTMLLSLTVVPYAAYLLSPFVIALAWLLTEKHLKSQGEMLSMVMFGWRKHVSAIIACIVASGIMFGMQALSQNSDLRKLQTNLISKQDAFSDGKNYSVNLDGAKVMLNADDDQVSITSIDANNKMTQAIFQKGDADSKFKLSVKHSSLPQLIAKGKLSYYQFSSMLLLILLMLAFAITHPLQNSKWPMPYGIASSLLLYISNMQLMHWLQKSQTPEYIPMLVCMALLVLYTVIKPANA